MSQYVGLHLHSEFSHLDGYARVTDIARRAKELGQSAVGLSDHGECGGHLAFVKACRAEGIRPILGMEAYYCPDISAAREQKLAHQANSHSTLIAATRQGLSNLWALASLSHSKKNFYYKPLVDPDLIAQYGKDIWASEGCMLTDLGRAVDNGDEDRARQYVARLASLWGERLFVEAHTWRIYEPVTDHDKHLNELMTNLNQVKVRLATEMGLPLVVVNDAHHAWPQHWENRELFWQFNTHSKDDQVGANRQKADHMMGDDELIEAMGHHGIAASVTREAIANTAMIADSCEDIELGPTMRMPSLHASDHDDVEAVLNACEEGFKAKVIDRGRDQQTYLARLESELRHIIDTGYAGYFTVVADYVHAARTGTYRRWVDGGQPDPMPIGRSRGSAGGSLVSYLMGITEVDPIRYDLLFERFLNPARKSMPDIDVDFPRSKRPDMKEYVRQRFGEDCTCMIGTVVRSHPRAMLADLCRVFEVPFADRMAMSEVIDEAIEVVTSHALEADEDAEEEVSWAQVIEQTKGKLSPWATRYPEVFDKLPQMTGIARQSGVHAAGVLISRDPILGRIPTRVKNDTVTTMFDMTEVEELGAVKMDLLGLRHLDSIDVCQKLIEERHGIAYRYEEFGDEQFSDPAIWDQIDNGDTLGIFQLEASLASDISQRLKPRNERDVAAILEIGRPGVIGAGLLDVYLDRRAGTKEVTYDHPLMEQVTADSYGILVEQEQLMRASQLLAGFSASEADDLRKYVGKKKLDKLSAMKPRFVQGCLDNPEFTGQGGTAKIAEKIWASFEASGEYLFNRCVTGDTRVRLSGKGAGTGTMSVEDMWRRLHDLAPERSSRPGDPCRFCGRPAVHKGRGQCSACRAWRSKFRSNHPKRGLRSWSMGTDGRLHPNRIVDVHRNGELPVWQVTLEDGRSITATANHRHLTPAGWREVSELRVGQELLVCGGYEPAGYVSGRSRLTDVEASYAGARLPNQERHGTRSLGYRTGAHVALREWTDAQEWVCSEPGCTRSREAGDRIERAHLDGDRRNNDPSNLAMKCASHHKSYDYQVNGRLRRGQRGYPVIPTRIVAIKYMGVQEVYDLEMADPYHSWVGNDIVTHNSHAIGYALISAAEVWLKHYYYPEFITAMLATDDERDKKTGKSRAVRYLAHARRRGIPILPPDINASGSKFTLTDEGIRFGLESVRGVGESAASDILAKRPFTSFDDFLVRASGRGAAKKNVVLSLISIGAFDSLKPDRAELTQAYHDWRVWQKVAPTKRSRMDVDARVAHVAFWYDKHKADKDFAKEFFVPDFADPTVVSALELALTDTYITIDPMARYAEVLDDSIADAVTMRRLDKGAQFIVAGQIAAVRTTVTKKGRNPGAEMAHLDIERHGEQFTLVVFPRIWATHKTLLKEGAPVYVKAEKLDRGAALSQATRLDFLVED